MKKFEVSHVDGTNVIIRATNEEMARSFAMEQRYGPATKNSTWPCAHWNGFGLSVREIENV